MQQVAVNNTGQGTHTLYSMNNVLNEHSDIDYIPSGNGFCAVHLALNSVRALRLSSDTTWNVRENVIHIVDTVVEREAGKH